MTAVRTGDVVVTPMRRRHLAQVLVIEGTVHPRPWSEALFEGELDQPRSREYLVARWGPDVVGYAGMMTVVEDAHITNVAVDPVHHRQGIATRLMVQLMRRAADRGTTQATLEVRWSNEGAQALYRRFGFAPGGVRKGYYADSGEDAMIMWAHDIDLPTYAERLAGIEASLPTPTVLEGFPQHTESDLA